MSRRCCCGGCVLLFSDDFDRSDSTDIGPKWEDRAGDWWIDGQSLLEKGNADALVWAEWDLNATRVVVRVFAEDVADGTKHRVIILGEDDDNYYYGQFEGFADTFRIVVGKREDGFDTELDEWTSDPAGPPPDALLCLAFNGNMLSFSPGESEEGVWTCLTDPGTACRKIGLWNDGGEPIKFDDFEIWTYDYSDPVCYCMCSCKEGCIPKTITATITGTGGCYPKLDGVEIEMTRGADGSWGYNSTWGGEEEVCDCGWCVDHIWQMALVCARPPEDFKLYKTSNNQCTTTLPAWQGTGTSKWQTPPDSYQCDPFIMVFGPFTIDQDLVIEGQCDCCSDNDNEVPYGTYTITLTGS